MNLALIAIVLAIGAGAVVAVSTREAAAAALGLAVALVAAALFSDPLPSAAVLGVRIVAALLVAALIRWAGRNASRQASALGWPGEALLATAAAVAGIGVAVGLASIGFGGDGPTGGPAAGTLTETALVLAAAASLLAVGLAPLIHGRLGVRRAIGLVLVTQAVLLVRVGLAGPASGLEEIARAALLVAAAATGSALARASAAGAKARRPGAEDEAGGAAEAEPPTSATGPRRPAATA